MARRQREGCSSHFGWVCWTSVQCWQALTLLLFGSLIFFALPLRTTLTILLSCLLLISAFAPTLHPRQAELFVALTLVLPLYAFISNAEEKPALWAGSGAIIVGTVVRSASQRMVDDAKGLDKLRYSAPEA